MSGLLQLLDLSSLPDGRSIAYSGGCLYIFLTRFHLMSLCNNFYSLGTLVGCWSSVFINKEDYLQILNYVYFYTAFVVSGKVGIPFTGLITPVGQMSLLQLTIQSRSEIVVLSKFLVAYLCCFLEFSFGVMDFAIGLGHISAFIPWSPCPTSLCVLGQNEKCFPFVGASSRCKSFYATELNFGVFSYCPVCVFLSDCGIKNLIRARVRSLPFYLA